MNIGSKEHYEILEEFEKSHKFFILDKENKKLWKMGQVYQNGETNKLYNAFIKGYAFGRAVYL